jgi:hypothetical protein
MMSKNDKNVTLQRMSLRAKRGNPVIKMPLMKSAGLPRRYAPDGTTSHSTKPASWQVAGYRNDHLFGSGSSGLGLATSQCGRTA